MTRPPPTHRCKICGALWILFENQVKPKTWPDDMPWSDAFWSLSGTKCGPCCDNVAMGDQIEKLEV